MKKLALLTIATFLIGGSLNFANGQGFLKKLGQKAKEKVENRVENAIDKKMDEGLDKVENAGKKDKKADTKVQTEATEVQAVEQTADQAAPQEKTRKEVQTAYAKSDFVPGDEIFFEDDFANEQLGASSTQRI